MRTTNPSIHYILVFAPLLTVLILGRVGAIIAVAWHLTAVGAYFAGVAFKKAMRNFQIQAQPSVFSRIRKVRLKTGVLFSFAFLR